MVLHNKDWQQISFYSCAAKFQTFVPTHSSFSSAVCAQKPTRHQPWSDGRFLTLTQRHERWHTNMFKHTLFHTLIAARLVVSHVHYKAHTPLSPRTRDRHMSPDLNSQPLHVLLTPGLHVMWSGLNLVHLWGFCGRVLGVDVCPGVEGPSCCCWGVTAGISQSL